MKDFRNEHRHLSKNIILKISGRLEGKCPRLDPCILTIQAA